MAREIVVQVGPLATASATNIATSQKAAGAQFLVLNGTTGVATANNICLSQTTSGAVNLVLNGSLAVTVNSVTTAVINQNQYVYITSAGNDSGITFTITGIAFNQGKQVQVSETVTGANTSTVSSAKQYYTITSIATSGATSGSGVTVGTYGTATLDTARNVIITSGGADTGITFTITGTDWYGDPISEAVTGASGAAAESVLSYATVSSIKTSGAVATTVTVGTIGSAGSAANGVASSPWIRLDEFGALGPTALQVTTTGTATSTVQQTLDDTTSLTNNVLPASVVWINHPDSALVGVTGNVQGNYAYPPVWARIILTSSTAGAGNFAVLKLVQNWQK